MFWTIYFLEIKKEIKESLLIHQMFFHILISYYLNFLVFLCTKQVTLVFNLCIDKVFKCMRVITVVLQSKR